LITEHETADQEAQQVSEDALSTNEELIIVNRDLESHNLALASTRHFATSIVEAVRVPLVVLDDRLTIQTVNTSFARAFRVSPGDVEGHPFDAICDGAWDAPELRDLLRAVLSESRAFDGFELEREFAFIGTRT
jgi:PAS domain-containing protein